MNTIGYHWHLSINTFAISSSHELVGGSPVQLPSNEWQCGTMGDRANWQAAAEKSTSLFSIALNIALNSTVLGIVFHHSALLHSFALTCT